MVMGVYLRGGWGGGGGRCLAWVFVVTVLCEGSVSGDPMVTGGMSCSHWGSYSCVVRAQARPVSPRSIMKAQLTCIPLRPYALFEPELDALNPKP